MLHDVSLYNKNIGKMPSPQRVQTPALSLSLFLLLGQALVTTKFVSDFPLMRSEMHILLLVDGFELNSVDCVLSPLCEVSTVEVVVNVMPTKTTDLNRDCVLVILLGLSIEVNPITARTWPKVQVRDVHLLETERAFLASLVLTKRENQWTHGSSASTTDKHVLLHCRSSTRLVRPRGHGAWIVSM